MPNRRYTGFRHSDSVFRGCSRCGRELTDAASRECGIGPICRRKNNAIFARHLPANLNFATALVLDLQEQDMHDAVRDQFEGVKSLYLRRLTVAQSANEDHTRARVTGADFREIVDWFDLVLSYPHNTAFRNKLILIIEHLGYGALAGILRGDVCMSKAKLHIEGNRIFLTGKSSKPGYKAMKENVPNVKTPRYRGDSTPYSALVKHADTFISIALRHWPFIEDNTDELLTQAEQLCSQISEEELNDDRPVAKIDTTVSNDIFSVSAPWHGTHEEMMAMIEKFKEIPRAERKYNNISRSWEFKNAHLSTIQNIVSSRYRLEIS